MTKPKNILLVKNRALGDSVMGLSSVQYLRKIHPKANIIYAVPQWVAPLYKNTKTDADSIYPLSLKTLKEAWKTISDIRKMKVDHIHEMHLSGRGAKVFRLAALLWRIPYTYHNHHLTSGTKVIDQGVKKPLIQRDLDGVYSYLGEGEVPSFLDFPPALKVNKPAKALPRIIFGVVATRPSKMWPLENYVKLAHLIEKNLPDFQIVIPLSKSQDDAKIKSELESLGLSKNTQIISLPLAELPQYFAESAFYVGNDTGLKHIAIACGIRTYTLFGPEPVIEWHPYDSKAHPYFYRDGLSCRTRTHSYCGLFVCDLKENNMQCLRVFTPEIVMEEIKPYSLFITSIN